MKHESVFINLVIFEQYVDSNCTASNSGSTKQSSILSVSTQQPLLTVFPQPTELYYWDTFSKLHFPLALVTALLGCIYITALPPA